MMVNRKVEDGEGRASILFGATNALYLVGIYCLLCRFYNLNVRGNYGFLILIILFFASSLIINYFYFLKNKRFDNIISKYDNKKNNKIGYIFIGAIFFLTAFILWLYSMFTLGKYLAVHRL